jgi:hypothetical protein
LTIFRYNRNIATEEVSTPQSVYKNTLNTTTEEGRLPKEVMKWRPPGRIKRRRSKLTWAEGIRGLIGERGFVEEDWNDRHNWRKKLI